MLSALLICGCGLMVTIVATFPACSFEFATSATRHSTALSPRLGQAELLKKYPALLPWKPLSVKAEAAKDIGSHISCPDPAIDRDSSRVAIIRPAKLEFKPARRHVCG